MLGDALRHLDCFVVRSPAPTARTLIRGDIKYSLLLFDDDPSGAELERFARSLAHREHTPVILFKKLEGFGRLLATVKRQLDC
ncbi:MAG: hypothetical protein M3416_03160 [Acidobacteriota bacterium]|nr:hypothetical protein [Acidobacteriota bacterium]